MNKQNFYNFLQNVIALFTVKVLELALTLGLIPYLIFKIGIANYGRYAFVMSFILFFVNVLNYGFDLSTVRDLAINKNNPTKVNDLFNQVFSIKLFLLIVVYCVVFGLLCFVPRFLEDKNIYLLGTLLLIADLFSLRWFFLGIEKMKFITIISFLSTLLFVSLVLIFVQNKSDYIFIPLAEFLGSFFTYGISFVWVLKKYQIKIKLLSIHQIIVYLKSNFYSYINLLLPSTTGVLIVFLVGLFGVSTNVAFMQIGVKVTSAFSTVNTVLTTVFYPMVNRDKKNIVSSRFLLISIGLFLSLVMYFGNGFLITHWLKLKNETDFTNTTAVINFMSPIPFLMGVISSYGVNGLLVQFEDQLYCWITLGVTIFMVVLACLLTVKFVIIGGAIAFVVARALYALLSYSFFKIKANEVR